LNAEGLWSDHPIPASPDLSIIPVKLSVRFNRLNRDI
jgi:hypothetical protein